MSKVFKSSNITFDENNRVYINSVSEQPKSKNEVPTALRKSEINSLYKKAELHSKDIIKDAKINAEKIISDALNEAEIIKNKAMEDGYNNGYEKAKVETEIERNTLKEEMAIEYEKMRASNIQEKDNMLYEVEPQIVDLIYTTVEKITLSAIDLNKELILLLIKKGLDSSNILSKAIIKVAEDDYENVFSKKDEMLKLVDSSKEIEIIKDFTLLKGDCLIETEYGNISCGIGQHLGTLKNHLYTILNNR
ncbi:MAG: FliH/SctL family protein [Lachnospirales bacterium]